MRIGIQLSGETAEIEMEFDEETGSKLVADFNLFLEGAGNAGGTYRGRNRHDPREMVLSFRHVAYLNLPIP